MIIPSGRRSNQADGMRIILVLTTGVAIALSLGVFRSQPYHPPLHRVRSHMFSRRTGFTNNLLPLV